MLINTSSSATTGSSKFKYSQECPTSRSKDRRLGGVTSSERVVTTLAAVLDIWTDLRYGTMAPLSRALVTP